MNIYIYGNQSFTKEIHSTLDKANIKFKLDDDTRIININELEELKNTIKANPLDIYLIDDEKIIKKDSLNKKIKFLAPSDGIEEEFLLDNGIADLSVDSLKEIPKYILKKYEENRTLDPNIHASIVDIVDEAYEQEELDDELSQLLASEDELDEKEQEVFNEFSKNEKNNPDLEKIENLINEIDKPQDLSFEENVGLDNITKDYDDIDSLEDKQELENDFEEIDDTQTDFNSMQEVKVDENEDENLDEFLDMIKDSDDFNPQNFEEEIEEEDIQADFNSMQEVKVDENEDEDLDEFLSMMQSENTLENSIEEIKDNSVEISEEKEVEEDLISEKKEKENIDNQVNNIQKIVKNEDFFEQKEENPFKGDEVGNISQIDEISKKDMLDALGLDSTEYIENISSTDIDVPKNKALSSNRNLELNSASKGDLAELLSTLLNNKTIEVTIKIKD